MSQEGSEKYFTSEELKNEKIMETMIDLAINIAGSLMATVIIEMWKNSTK